MEIVRKIMLREETPAFKLYGKTGWQTAGDLNDPNGSHSLGWFVGYPETQENVYFFAMNLETPKTQNSFAQ